MNSEFCVDFIEICPKGSIEWEWVILGQGRGLSRWILERVSRVELL